MPKLSIITINYNNLEGLKRTVESVVNQTWQEFEYIVIDGGSTDGSVEYIESQSHHFDYWISEADKGIYNAMNKGIRVATGEYLLFLNSGDDFVDLKSLENNHLFFSEIDIIYFDINVIDDDVFFVKKCPDLLPFSFLFVDTLPHQSTLIRRNLFERIGYYDENLKIVADWKFFIIALMKNGASYKHVDKVFTNYYLDGISARVDYSEERSFVMKEHFSGFILDYEELYRNRALLNAHQALLDTNRYRMLQEIEKTKAGMKIVSVFFRIYIVLFSKKKINKILN